jgi:hypothetical protein
MMLVTQKISDLEIPVVLFAHSLGFGLCAPGHVHSLLGLAYLASGSLKAVRSDCKQFFFRPEKT